MAPFVVFGDIAVGVSVILQNNSLVMLNILSDYLLLAFSLQSLLKGKRHSGILMRMTQMPEMGTLGACVEGTLGVCVEGTLGACVEGTQWECGGATREARLSMVRGKVGD